MEFDYRGTEAGKWRFSHADGYEKSVEFQDWMAKHEKVAWHNPFSDECTLDFACCMGDKNYDRYIPSFKVQFKQLLEELYLECEHGDNEHRKWLKDKFNQFYIKYSRE